MILFGALEIPIPPTGIPPESRTRPPGLNGKQRMKEGGRGHVPKLGFGLVS
jgi:hypothetical protein